MDGVSSAFAVVSLAIQLVNNVKRISKFLHSINDAPNEVLRLREALDQLQGILDNAKIIVDQQSTIPGLPGSVSALTSALEFCETRVQKLENFLTIAQRRSSTLNRIQRSWSSLRIVLNREEIEKLHSQVREASARLHIAISTNSAISGIEYLIQDQ